MREGVVHGAHVRSWVGLHFCVCLMPRLKSHSVPARMMHAWCVMVHDENPPLPKAHNLTTSGFHTNLQHSTTCDTLKPTKHIKVELQDIDIKHENTRKYATR